MRGRVLLALAMLTVSGCLAPTALEAASLPEGLPDVLRLLEDRAFEVEVPVRVVLVGFEPGTAEALQERLAPARIDHDFLSARDRVTRQDPAGDWLEVFPAPTLPVARYAVEAAPADFAAEALAFAASSRVEGGDVALYDGNAVEVWFAERLAPDADTPVFVVLHGGGALEAEHGWRYVFESGWLDRVRIFGGRLPLLVFDASAQPDPYVVRTTALGTVFGAVAAPRERPAYDYPLEAGGEATVEALAQAATDAAHYRILQGPIYPVTTRPCHTVLAYVGVRSTAVAHRLGMSSPESLVDTAALEASFANLTGAPVTVAVKVVQLPHEDPVLDAATRNDLNYDLFRAWADAHWDSFFEDDGCEQYLSTLLVTDAAERLHGIALMDVERGRRISFSWVDDVTRLRDEDDGPLRETPLGSRPESRTASRWGTFLLAHETGHLFGQTHPHNAIRDSDAEGERAPSPSTMAFSATWDAMSYQAMDRVADFGAVPAANYQRNRAGFAVEAAREAGLEGTPEFEQALDLLRRHEWRAASDLLLAAVGTSG